MRFATTEAQTTGRPVGTMPINQIVQLSIYWFGINAIWGGLNNVILQVRMDDLVGPANAETGLAVVTLLGAVVAILVQPTIGTISDYTSTRWGRRKPYILIGAVLDVVFLVGIATSNTYISVVAFVVLLQVSSNFAQGPFQGYVPDLVPLLSAASLSRKTVRDSNPLPGSRPSYASILEHTLKASGDCPSEKVTISDSLRGRCPCPHDPLPA